MLGRLLQGVGEFQKELSVKMRAIFEQLSTGQKPDILFITCADSRVIPSLITKANPGELFVIRNIGNMIPEPEVESSEAVAIEYALKVLKVPDIIVCGHSDCGAMKGLLNSATEKVLPKVASWLHRNAHSVLKEMEEKQIDLGTMEAVETAAKKNVLAQLEHLRSDPLIAEKLAKKEVNLHGWYYDIKTSEIYIYVPQYNDFIKFEQAVAHSIEEKRTRFTEQAAMNYLEEWSHPKTATEYAALMRLFSESKGTAQKVWPHIEETVSKKLWAEFSSLYPSIDAPEFTSMLRLGAQVKLPRLKDFHENIEGSTGYKQFCSQIMHRLCFFTPAPVKQMQEATPSPYGATFNK